ncbi:hypothetical protein BDC45DRAFT_523157 [Circinella umbellata]|nr:hypothetical protein BDC45DRAFT_523157 [Circinella umbellata]
MVAGTLAETMVTAVSEYNKNSRTKTSFTRFFDNLANYEEQKSRFRTSMAEQVAAEEEDSNARKRCSTRNKEDKPKRQKLNNNSNDDDNDNKDYKGVRNIWDEWREFLTNKDNTCHLMQLSPEKHGVIWCGKLVRRRSCLPVTLFEKLNKEVMYVKATNISLYFLSQANEIVDTSSREAMGNEIEVLQRMVPEERSLIPEKKIFV